LNLKKARGLANTTTHPGELPATSDVGRSHLLSTYPWLTFLLPFIVYMVVGSFEPSPPKQAGRLPDGTPATPISNNWFGLEYRHYPVIYTAKIVLTIAAMIVVAPGYRQFPFRVSVVAIIVGVIGVVLWIEISKLGIEQRVVDQLGKDSKVVTWLGLGERPAYKPLQELVATPIWMYSFLAIRFIGLALIVPILEEFFLRGFLMRVRSRPQH
jgi:hypothetical protein